MMYASKLEELAERLCARLRRVDDEAENDEDHSAPGEYVRANAAEYGVDLRVMDRLDVGDCGWIVPLRLDGQWAVVTYHYGAGWECYVGEYIPAWIAKQLPS